jgi:hypothetical protein
MTGTTTYTTSDNDATAAGIKTLTENSFPPRSTIDTYRLATYRKIGFWIGYGTPDINGIAAGIEEQIVAYAIKMCQLKQAFIIQLLPDQIEELKATWPDANSFGTCFEPDQNGSLSG